MRAYRLTVAAGDDLAEIYRYSQQQWGEQQADKYYHQMVASFEQLAANPLLGKPRFGLPREMWSYLQSSHLIFYQPDVAGITIFRILHKSCDVQRHLS